jgi:putative colanic acid biosynthesis UDP-glucose lipid carrier transferase
VDVRLVPERSFGAALPVHGVSTVLGMPVIDLWRRPLGAWDLVVKAIEDRVLGAVLLLVAAIPMAIIALAIRLDSSGPVFFKQKRAGFGQSPFTMYKFRSMVADCDPPGTVPQARRNDPRVTRVGRILRRYSLDEVPQLINVLRGEMSLVGPRPHAMAHDSLYAKAIGDYLARQRVKPGMTGWAQIHGLRGQTETPEKMRQRVAMDLYYIDNWSLGLDLKILALTPFVVLLQDQAY